MDYRNDNQLNYDTVCSGERGLPEPRENLTELMKSSRQLAEEILDKTCAIDKHLFGIGELDSAVKRADPYCFRDELSQQIVTLEKVYDEILKIGSLIGL